jgi:hypothetical protein
LHGNARARTNEGAYHRECRRLMYSSSHAAVVLPRNCCPIPLTLMRIFPVNAVKLSHQCCANTPNAAALGHRCCTDGAPAQLNRCTVAAKQVPRRCCADVVTLVIICKDANEQESDADAQIPGRRCTTVPTMLRCFPDNAAQVPGTSTQVPER